MKNIFDFLSVGEKNAITAQELARLLGWDVAEALLNEMRQEGTQA